MFTAFYVYDTLRVQDEEEKKRKKKKKGGGFFFFSEAEVSPVTGKGLRKLK